MKTEKTPERLSVLLPYRSNALPAWLADGELWCLLLVGLLMMLNR